MPEWFVWGLVVLLIIVGVIGAVIPGVPGLPMVFAAAVIHKAFLPEYLSWWTVALLAVFAVVAFGLEIVFAAAGGKSLGATHAGLVGGGVGAFAGIFFGFIGMFLGAVLGAIIAEVFYSKKSWKAAAKAGIGTGLGLLASTVGKAMMAFIMVSAFLLDCFLY